MLFRKSFCGKVSAALNDGAFMLFFLFSKSKIDSHMNRRFLHSFSLKVIAALFCVLVAHPLYSAQLVDRVVAVVNDDVITLSELNDAGHGYFKKITQKAPSDQLEEALRRARREVLNNLIDTRLISQEAMKQGIVISEEEIQAAAAQMLITNKMTREILDDQLTQMGMSYDDYLETLRSQILQSKLINFEIRSKLIITDDMILDYYDSNYIKHISDGGYYLMQMGFIWGENSPSNSSAQAQYADKIDAKKRAERVHALVKNGKDFRSLAKKFSDLPSAADGGDLGVFQEDEMAPYMQDAVLSLNPGEISDVIETPSGYQFFKLLSSQDGKIVVQASFASVKEEIRAQLYDQQLKERFEEWVSKIKKEAYIKRL